MPRSTASPRSASDSASRNANRPDRVPRAGEKVLRALAEIASRFEECREPARDRGVFTRVVRHERARDAAAQRRTPRRLERGIQRVLVEHVDELILQRQRQVRELVLLGRA